MNPISDDAKLLARIAVIETRIEDLREDFAEQKDAITGLRDEIRSHHEGLSRAEKIALTGVSVSLVMAVFAALALILNAA
jgi:hypothetical protein